MSRNLKSCASVQAQLDELTLLKSKVKILEDELKSFMDENDIERLEGLTTMYTRTWSKDTLRFNSSVFKKEQPALYESYKTLEVAGCYKYSIKAIK